MCFRPRSWSSVSAGNRAETKTRSGSVCVRDPGGGDENEEESVLRARSRSRSGRRRKRGRKRSPSTFAFAGETGEDGNGLRARSCSRGDPEQGRGRRGRGGEGGDHQDADQPKLLTNQPHAETREPAPEVVEVCRPRGRGLSGPSPVGRGRPLRRDVPPALSDQALAVEAVTSTLATVTTAPGSDARWRADAAAAARRRRRLGGDAAGGEGTS